MKRLTLTLLFAAFLAPLAQAALPSTTFSIESMEIYFRTWKSSHTTNAGTYSRMFTQSISGDEATTEYLRWDIPAPGGPTSLLWVQDWSFDGTNCGVVAGTFAKYTNGVDTLSTNDTWNTYFWAGNLDWKGPYVDAYYEADYATVMNFRGGCEPQSGEQWSNEMIAKTFVSLSVTGVNVDTNKDYLVQLNIGGWTRYQCPLDANGDLPDNFQLNLANLLINGKRVDYNGNVNVIVKGSEPLILRAVRDGGYTIGFTYFGWFINTATVLSEVANSDIVWTDDGNLQFGGIEPTSITTDGTIAGGTLIVGTPTAVDAPMLVTKPRAKIAIQDTDTTAGYSGLSFYDAAGTEKGWLRREQVSGDLQLGTATKSNALTVQDSGAVILEGGNLRINSTGNSNYALQIKPNFALTNSLQFIGPWNARFLNYNVTGNVLQLGNSAGKVQILGDDILALNGDGTGFNALKLGGDTASFPSIRRDGTTIKLRLADNSGDAPITASSGTFSGSVYADSGISSTSATITGTVTAGGLSVTGTGTLGAYTVNANNVTASQATVPIIYVGSGGPIIMAGSGAPTSTPSNGSLYLRTDGTGPNLYVRENGAWVAK